MRHEFLAALEREIWAIEASTLVDMRLALSTMSDADLSARISGREERTSRGKRGAIGVLPIHGVLTNRPNFMSMLFGGTSTEDLGRVFRAMVEDDDTKAIVLDVDSPGGQVAGTDELSSLIHSARGHKPVVAQVNSRAGSAAYWIASAAQEMVMNPSAQVGSIGVLAAHDDLSARMEREGMKRTLISSAKYKTEGHPFAPLEAEALSHIQKSVMKSHKVFVSTVARNRGTTQTDVNENFGQGRMVDADDAVKAGMADRIGTLEQTLARFGVSAPTGSARRAFAIEREMRALALIERGL